MDLTTGWQKHPGVPGGYHLEYYDTWIGEVSIVTGPKGSGLMAANDPGQDPLTKCGSQGWRIRPVTSNLRRSKESSSTCVNVRKNA